MKNRNKASMILAVAVAALVLVAAGCSKDEPQQHQYNPQPTVATSQPAYAVSNVPPQPQDHVLGYVNMEDMAGTSAHSAAGTYTRTIREAQVGIHPGPAAGEAVKGVEPFKAPENKTPAITQTEYGPQVGQGSYSFQGGGTETASWLSLLWSKVSFYFWCLVVAWAVWMVIGGVLFFIPGTTLVGAWMLKAGIGVIPFIGALVLHALGASKTNAAIADGAASTDAANQMHEETVAGIQNFKSQFPSLAPYINAALKGTHSPDTMDWIKHRKIDAGLPSSSTPPPAPVVTVAPAPIVVPSTPPAQPVIVVPAPQAQAAITGVDSGDKIN